MGLLGAIVALNLAIAAICAILAASEGGWSAYIWAATATFWSITASINASINAAMAADKLAREHERLWAGGR